MRQKLNFVPTVHPFNSQGWVSAIKGEEAENWVLTGKNPFQSLFANADEQEERQMQSISFSVFKAQIRAVVAIETDCWLFLGFELRGRRRRQWQDQLDNEHESLLVSLSLIFTYIGVNPPSPPQRSAVSAVCEKHFTTLLPPSSMQYHMMMPLHTGLVVSKTDALSSF